MKTIGFATAIALGLMTASAFAQGGPQPAPMPAPAQTDQAGPPGQPSPAPQAQALDKLPDGCQYVTFSQPVVNSARPDIQITLRGYGADVEAIKVCNPEALRQKGDSQLIGVAPSPTAGARISLRTKKGSAVAAMPSILADGDASQNYCDLKDGSLVNYIFKRVWSGGLPSKIDLQDETSKLSPQDVEFYQKACIASAPPNIRAALKQ